MNFFEKVFGLISLALVFAFSSCNPIEDKVEEIDEPDSIKNYIVIGEDTFEIKSAGYYYDSEADGYDVVFSSSELDLSKPLSDPEGVILALDIPGCDMNATSDLTTIFQGDNWEFYMGYFLDGNWQTCDGTPLIKSNSIKSGEMMVKLKKAEMDFNFTAILNNGVEIKCSYNGSPVVSSEYLWI